MGDKGAFRIGDGNQATPGGEGRGAGGVNEGPRRSGPVPQHLGDDGHSGLAQFQRGVDVQ